LKKGKVKGWFTLAKPITKVVVIISNNKGAFTLGVRDASFESLNTMLVI
jgi:hypothetical protein